MLELVTLPQGEQNEIWSALRVSYQPSALFRVRLVVFRDADGHEGFNAVVRIDDSKRPNVVHYLWLDRIASVTPLGSA